MKPKILFCGTNVPNEIEYKVKSISAAGNRFQNNLLSTMRQMGYSLDNLSFIGVPIGEKECLEVEQTLVQGMEYHAVVKKGTKKQATAEYTKLLKQKVDYADIVMCYNVIYAWMKLPALARRKNKKSILILADYSEAKSYTSPIRKLYAYLQLRSIRRFDVVVGLSASVEAKLKKSQKFILMEGGIDEAFYNYFESNEKKKSDNITFLYSGLISHVTGVDLLLKAFKEVKNPRARLKITGKGDLEELVIAAGKVDNRISYLGHLEYVKYMEELKNADVLVNPRNMNLPENQNNFPSKVLDYLATGNAIISTKFVGWEKFQDKIQFVESDMERLEEMIELICSDIPNLRESNREAAEKFLWKNQIERIFMETL